MAATHQTKAQLLQELAALRQRNAQLEAAVVEQQQTAAAVRASAQRYHHMVEQSLGLMCIHSLDGTLLAVNPAAARALGYAPEAWRGRNLREFLAPAVQPLFEAYLARIQHQPTDSGLMCLLTRTGEERIWLYRNVRYEEAGAAPYVIGHALDVTERVQAEQALKQMHADLEARVQERTAALQEAETMYRTLVEQARDAIVIVQDGQIRYANPACETLSGYTREEVCQQPPQAREFLAPADQARVVGYYAQRLRGEAVLDCYEATLVRKDGQPVMVEIKPCVITYQGQPAIMALLRDITAQKQAATEVERRRREAETLADIAQGLSASLDLDTVLHRVVAGVQELCGSARAFIALREPGTDTLIGCYEVGAPRAGYVGQRLEPGQGLGGQVLRTGRPWRTADYIADTRFSKGSVVGGRAGGHLAMLAVPILMGEQVAGVLYASNPVAHPFTDRDEGVLVRLAAHAAVAIQNAQLYQQVQTDLVERRRAEEQLTVSLQEKEVLLKEIHHRVKNNLQIISSLLSLQSDTTADPCLLAQFQDSQNRVRSMALVHETLYQSQNLARLDMAPFIHALSTHLMQSYDVDPRRLALRIRVDQLALGLDQAIPCGLILNELLTNAFKYAFPGGAGVVHVELHSVTAQQARLIVRDTGVGLPAGLDLRHTVTLGLQLVCILTEQLEGTIMLERTGGTTFTLTFPVLR